MNSVFILLNNLNDWKPYYETDSIMFLSDYLEHRYESRKPQLVINLANDYSYNSEGYYCSLLAQARGHRVLPAVETLNKLESGTGIRMSDTLQKQCYQWICHNNITDNIWYLNIYFGTCKEKGLEKIARFIFDNYPCPMLRVTFNTNVRNQIENVQSVALPDLTDKEQDEFATALDNFNKKVWRSPRSSRSPRYSLAILYDPAEKFPPSDTAAMHKFLDVAKRMNIHAELITEEDALRLMEFDGLFIRTTTSLNHYTFHLSQKAALNDMVVIDDPESIIRCTNKVYLCELFEKGKISAPQSLLLFRSDKMTFDEISAQVGMPFIIKIPDGSFSIGMYKVSNETELDNALKILFERSSILLVQAFTPTEFDWRIGILDGEPLFACKYYMAKGHWQIYNHAVTGKNLCGPWETIPIYQVPPKVVDLALKAAGLIGKGLYGVDLKVVDGKPMVIEINDNPSIDHEVEDAVLGDELYYRILNYFVHKQSQKQVGL
ncbi:MAG: RimK family alpha-L-glutamate ligase [Sphingobacteriia bacterium]|nr:RimK family alpha-L-glutamate ligase [Sphingobacteriia bacterium]